MWAHDHWDLEVAPDIVTFAKKAQIAGYFSGPQMRPKEGEKRRVNRLFRGVNNLFLAFSRPPVTVQPMEIEGALLLGCVGRVGRVWCCACECCVV